ncbi:MAG: DUF87 domain-containing protein [Acidobacteria bacterium]|nr:DUF87 domain-containing protein [Acidobacteriota bacterium]MBV9184212.1 DUF87 domain-containing protein [Acidobacteriota bacterium]
MTRTIRFRFETDATRRMQEVQQFYLDNDGFIAEHRKRAGRGFPIGTYQLPTRGKLDAQLLATDLDRHALVLGSTGTGKSSLLELLARMCFATGRGCALIDPHGDLFQRVTAWALHAEIPDLTILDFTRPELLPGWNPLKPLPGVDPGRQVDLLIGIFKRLYADEEARSFAFGVKVQEILRYSFLAALTSTTPCTIDTLRSFLLIPALRSRLLATASADVRFYFHERFKNREENFVPAVLNKLEPFLGSMAVQRFLGQPTNTVDPLAIMDRGGTLLVNLAKGYLGPTADILGRLLMNALELGALRREGIPPEQRTPYTLLVDEAHTFAGSDGALDVLLTAARKYRLSLVLAAQALTLFPTRFQTLALGNAGHQFLFRLPQKEAQHLAPDLFEPQGNFLRPRLHAHDKIEYLTPSEEIAARTKELANLPIGACYWLDRGKPYKARRVQVRPPDDLPMKAAALSAEITAHMAQQRSAA